MQVQLGEEGEALQKEQSILEAVAYRDTWGKGTDSYLYMMYERLTLMRDLLSERGSIYVHYDWHIGHSIKILLDEIFIEEHFNNHITWKRSTPRGNAGKKFPELTDYIFFYSKTYASTWNPQFLMYKEKYIERYYSYVNDKTERRFQPASLLGHEGINPIYEWRGLRKPWRYPRHRLEELDLKGLIYWPKEGEIPRLKRFIDEQKGVPLQSLWDDIPPVNSQAIEDTKFISQKPEALLERIIKVSSNEGDLVADFFCGSGTTLAVAEKLGRRWIGVDLGRYAIHTTRKRLIQVQRELHEAKKPYRSFDVYNLGRYERQWWQMEKLKGADEEHRKIVLQFYKAAPLSNPPNPLLHGKKAGAYVHVDQIDSIFSYEELRAAADAARAAGGRELHCLAWEFEMELALKKQAVEAETGLDIRLRYIPREIMEPNRTECQFFEAGYLEAKIVKKGKKADVELVCFTPALAEAPETEMAELRQRAVKSPFDFIDFWAVDFEWSKGKPFEHHWQDFRTRKDRSLKIKTDIGWEHKKKGRKNICVKVIDVFGVDTTAVIETEP
ncbi:MAG: site-specific DNA-methyltransferase [Candidatus Aminicenantales bacterium]